MNNRFNKFYYINQIIQQCAPLPRDRLSSDFLHFLVSTPNGEGRADRIPPLRELGARLGVSVARLREQLEVARTLGLVEVRPKTGIRRLPYSFLPAVRHSLAYALELDREYFTAFSELRIHVEAAFWREAIACLTSQDHQELRLLIERAWQKLRAERIQIPHQEHRELHLAIFRRLENPFVLGILEAYWEAYEAVGLNLYADYDYLQRVWEYHQRMVEAICAGDAEAGYQALVEHKDLLYHRPVTDMARNGNQ